MWRAENLMQRGRSGRLLRAGFFLTLALAGGSASTSRAAPVDAEQVRQAIERGVQYLRRNQGPDGRWNDIDAQPGGVTALCALALLSCGVEPGDPQITKALNYLRTLPPKRTYATALQTMVLCLTFPERHGPLIRRNLQWFEDQQVTTGEGKGAWSYPGATPDNSNSQFALLAMYEAERVGISASDRCWRLAQNYWLEAQNGDGSWGYRPRDPAGSGSMTCAGIGAVIIAGQKLNESDARVIDGRLECCGPQAGNGAVERGLDWLGRRFSVKTNPGGAAWLLYYLYALERVGRLSAQRYIGGHDWYREGCEQLVANQDPLGGFWRGVGGQESVPQVGTSFALLFLSKGRRPVLVAKLRHGTGDAWNPHRSDLAHLTAYVEKRWKRDLSWQIVDSDSAKADDLLESPVLFLHGREPVKLADDQVRELRQYLDRGGFLFAESCCQGDAFDASFRQLIRRAFPEPEHELRPLPPEHPVWRAEEPIEPDRHQLWGLESGCRTSVIYCPEDLSCFWELSRPGRGEEIPERFRAEIVAANSLGINVLAYATNREVKYKLEGIGERSLAETRPEAYRRATLQLARLRHGGGWDAAPGALVALQGALSRELGMRLDTDRHDLALTDPALARFHLVFFHGRNDFRLSAAERAALKTYLERGGTVLADAICGSEAFTRAFRRELAEVWPDGKLERIPASDPLFSSQFNGFDLRQVSRRDPEPGGDKLTFKVRQVEPELEAVKFQDRYAVIFSPFDLSCALEKHESLECRGYTREDAARLAINVVLYSLH